MAAPAETIEQIRSTAIDLALKFGPKLLAALIILTIGYLVGRQVSRWLERALLHLEMEPPVRSLIVRIARVVVSLLFVIMAMQNLGVELLPLVAGLGVAGAGIALAMQGLLGNLFAGLTIIFTKPFRVGEYIGIVGEEGTVETITLFQTTLDSSGPLARGDPESQDRRRDPAQLRENPSARRHRRRRLRHRAQPGAHA